MNVFDCKFFDTQGCWAGLHIVFIIIGIIALIPFTVITFFSSIGCAESNILSNNPFSGIPSFYLIFNWGTKFSLAIIKGLIDIPEISNIFPDLLKFTIMFLINYAHEYTFEQSALIYNIHGKRLLRALSFISVVSPVIMLIVSSINTFTNTNLPGSILYLAFIAYTIWQQYEEKIYERNDWATSDNFMERIFGLFYLIRISEFKQDDLIVFHGFIFEYLKKCKNQEVIQSLINAINFLEGAKNADLDEKRRIILHKIIEAELDIKINENYNSVNDVEINETLILLKAQFLMEICKKTKSATALLKSIKTTKLWNTFWQQRMLKLMEDLQYDSDRKGREYLYLKLLKEESSLKNLLINEADLYQELWAYVSVDLPVIDKIESLVRKIIRIQAEVKTAWDKIESYNLSIPSLYRLYSHYLELVKGDTFYANKLRNIQQDINRTNKKKDCFTGFDLAAFREVCTPLLFASAEIKDLGIIQRINAPFSQITGYLQANISGQSLENIFSKIYKDCFTNYLVQMADSTEQNLYSKTTIFAKHANGYIFHAIMRIRRVTLLGQDAQFILSLENNDICKKGSFVLTDKEFKIVDVGEGANTALGLSKKLISHKKFYLHDLCVDLFEKDEQNNMYKLKDNALKSKKIQLIKYEFPMLTSEEVEFYKIFSSHLDFIRDDAFSFRLNTNRKEITFNVKIKEITHGKSGLIGYAFYFKNPDEKPIPPNQTALGQNQLSIPKAIVKFKYDEQLGAFIRDINIKPNIKSIIDTESIYAQDTMQEFEDSLAKIIKPNETHDQCYVSIVAEKISQIQQKIAPSQLKQFTTFITGKFKGIDYGKGILTYRINDYSKEIHEIPYLLHGEKQEEVVMDENMRSAGNLLLKHQDEETIIREMLKNREETKNYIKENFKMSSALLWFIAILTLLNISFMLVGIVQDIYMSNTITKLNRSLNYTTESFERACYMLESVQIISFTSYYVEYFSLLYSQKWIIKIGSATR